MKWDKVKRIVAKAAPVLGAAINPVAGGAVGSIIASALGVEEDADKIIDAIKSDPNAAVKLKEIEATHKEKLESMTLDLQKAELLDKQNAREAHKHSMMPAVICGALTVIVAISIYMLFMMPVPESNSDLIYILFGQVSALWGASITYWVGTTRSSAEKDRRNGVVKF